MNLFSKRSSLKYDFSRGRDEVRARTRAEFLAAAGVGFTVMDGGKELSDDQLDMLAAAGNPFERQDDQDE